MNYFLQKLLTFILLFVALQTTAQLRFSATVSPTKIGKNEYANVEFIVENAKHVEEINPPSLKNFIVVSGPNQSNGVSTINGLVKQYISISFTIQPKSIGNFTIQSASAKADGKLLRSNAVQLQVVNEPQGNNSSGSIFSQGFGGMDPLEDTRPSLQYNESVLRKGENALDKIKQNLIVKAVVNKTTCFIGEPIIVTYKLYTRLKSESSLTKNPSFNGFSVVDLQLPDNINYTQEKLNGKDYNVYVIRKSQLYPLQAGTLTLQSAEIENTVHLIKEEYINRRQRNGDLADLFGDIQLPAEAFENQKVSLKSEPIDILVKDLPLVNKPATFKSAVGKFQITAALDKDSFSTDDAGKILLLIKGEGNLQLVNAPDINWPAGMEGFEPKISDDINKLNVPLSGRKLVEYPFTINQPGMYSLAPIVMSYFDVDDQQYKTISTGPLKFYVSKGLGKRIGQASNTNSQVRFLNKLFNNRWVIVLFVAGFIIAGLLFWVARENKKDKAKNSPMVPLAEPTIIPLAPIKEEHALIENVNPLLEAANSIDDPNSAKFYLALNTGLKNYLAHWLGIHAAILDKKSIISQMDNRGVSNNSSLQLLQLMDELEWQLYTPFSATDNRQAFYDRAEDMISLLETYQIKHP